MFASQVNRRKLDPSYKILALMLPAPLQMREILVGAIGFEPTTPCAQGRCATRLRYAPTSFILNYA
jgi:hypothetical protein